jgi:hypothetical protein
MFDQVVNVATMVAIDCATDISGSAILQMWDHDRQTVKVTQGVDRRKVDWRKVVGDDIVEASATGLDNLFVEFNGRMYQWHRNSSRDKLTYVGYWQI